MIDGIPDQPPPGAPHELAAAWPLVQTWAASDDVERENLVEQATAEELRELIEAVEPLFPAINAYLDATGNAEAAVPYGDLAQAAIEAQLDLDRRSGNTTDHQDARPALFVDLRTSTFDTIDELWDALSEPCGLPAWFGRNLDAWADTLRIGISDVIDAHGWILIMVAPRGIFTDGNPVGSNFRSTTLASHRGTVAIL